MCHFITAVIGGTASLAQLNAIAKKHHRWFTPVENDTVSPYLNKNETYCFTLPKRLTCDCGTALGWFARELKRAPKPFDREAEIAKLQRKGWSQTKILRCLEAKEHNRQTWEPPSPEDLSDDQQNDQWLKLAQDMLAEPAVSSFGLMVHWYGGRLESRIPFKGRVEIDFGRAMLAKMEDCTLYVSSKRGSEKSRPAHR